MARFRPFQNPHSRKTSNMRPSVAGQAYPSVKRNSDSLTEFNEEAFQDVKSPWLRRVFLKRIRREKRDPRKNL